MISSFLEVGHPANKLQSREDSNTGTVCLESAFNYQVDTSYMLADLH